MVERAAPAAGKVSRVFVANRGEIAVRIIGACRDLGIETVLGVSTADRDTVPARLADRTVCLGPPPAGQSYLATDRVLAAALGTGCDALHPGYGFLSENPRFAAECVENGLTFVGPSADAIAEAADKARARSLAQRAGIPVLAGSDTHAELDGAVSTAQELGYPLLIKAAAGGGGRGMSVVENERELRERWQAAAAEAHSAFGDGRLYLERYVRRARHIEVQVIGDRHGAVVHLGDRDCSVQRRHQKLVEEAPAPGLPTAVRRSLHESGVAFGRALGLDSAGTVEFLYDADTREYAFLEFNARIQVEHPVTELVTGIDLVAEQLRVAAGEPLSFTQEDVAVRGHAVEARITAEDAQAGFRPTPGVVKVWAAPEGAGIRVDTYCAPGLVISPFYDSLLAKVIAHGPDRRAAIGRLDAALATLRVEGVATTADFHRFVLAHPDFQVANVSTGWTESRALPEYLSSGGTS